MNKITRRQKKEALSLLESRRITEGLAFEFLGWMERQAKFETDGEQTRTVGAAIADFVRIKNTEIRECAIKAE